MEAAVTGSIRDENTHQVSLWSILRISTITLLAYLLGQEMMGIINETEDHEISRSRRFVFESPVSEHPDDICDWKTTKSICDGKSSFLTCIGPSQDGTGYFISSPMPVGSYCVDGFDSSSHMRTIISQPAPSFHARSRRGINLQVRKRNKFKSLFKNMDKSKKSMERPV
ncbi:hypothetical protein HK098_001519 [Nowakowskiella sp. JEL0407]|nr:hypothetical protein HK098_001519 [Nowakowskiella sp. JEL0407]